MNGFNEIFRKRKSRGKNADVLDSRGSLTFGLAKKKSQATIKSKGLC